MGVKYNKYTNYKTGLRVVSKKHGINLPFYVRHDFEILLQNKTKILGKTCSALNVVQIITHLVFR